MAEGVLLLTYTSVSMAVSSPMSMSDTSMRGMNVDMHVDHVYSVILPPILQHSRLCYKGALESKAIFMNYRT